MSAMRTELFDYDLPTELIAQHPVDVRSSSLLLVLDRRACRWTDTVFTEIGSWLRSSDCLVLNDTLVIPAKFFARRSTGGRIEGLFISEEQAGRWLAMLKNAARLHAGEELTLLGRDTSDFCIVKAIEHLGEGQWHLEVGSEMPAFEILDAIGTPPLPPYIHREKPEKNAHIQKDLERYQTVYASQPGAIAAPTAGLHFTRELLEQLKAAGVELAHLTLHVGAGTFKPVTTEILDEHKMHSEAYSIGEMSADIINEAKDGGGRIVAVGTTTVRTLEAAAWEGHITPASSTTDLFIRPGYHFKMVDAMVTNFHLPRSTLIALVAAFAGLEFTMDAYQHAVEQRYRFYSYGDAMLVV